MDFHGTSFLGPRTARLEQAIPLPKLPGAFLRGWHVENVVGDGRCGYRSIARYVGVSWHRVLERLLAIMLTTDLFPSSHIIEMMSVQDPSNTCPQSCWLNSTHIRLLAASCPDWFAYGVYVVKVHEGERAIHFRTDGCVDSDANVTSTNACVLGLLTASAPHFVHLRPKKAAETSKSISQPAPCIQGGAHSPKSLFVDALPDDAMVQLLQFSLNPQMVTSWAPTCRTVCSHLANLATWKGQTFSVPSCQCQRLCANCCVRAASLACSFWEAYSPAAHLDFTLTEMSKRRPMLHKWNHVFDRSTESNIWFTSTNNATPPVFTLDCRYFRFDEKILSDLLEVRVGIVGTAVPAPYRLFTSNEQSHADDLTHLAAFDFLFEDTGCEVSAWPPVAPYKSVQCDFDAALYITIVFNQQDGLLSAFMPDGALLLSRRFPSFPKSQPCSSFLYLSSKRQTGSPKPCSLRDKLKVFQPRLSQGCAFSKFLPYVHLDVFHAGAIPSDVRFVFAVTITGGSQTQIRSPVCCLSFPDATLKGGGHCFVQDGWDKGFCGADSGCRHVLLQLPGQPVVCDFAFAVSGSPFHRCTISPTALNGASLVKMLQDIVGNVLEASPFTIRIQIALASISRTEHGDSLLPELAVQIACITARIDLADELYEAVKSSNYDNLHFCLAQGQCPNAATSQGFAPLHAALAQCHESPPLIAEALLRARANVNTAYACGSSPLHVACRQNNHAMVSRLLKANAYVNAIDHEGDTPLHTAGVYAEPDCVRLLLDWAACLCTRNLQGETSLIAAADVGGNSKTISLLLACGPPTSWTDVLLMGLYRLMRHLGYSSRQLFVTCRQFSLQQEFYPSAFHGGAFPFQDMPVVLAILTCAGDMKCVLAFPLAAKAIYSLLKLSTCLPPMRISIVPCTCNRLCLNQSLLSLLPEGESLQHVGTEANLDEHSCDTEAVWAQPAPCIQGGAHSLTSLFVDAHPDDAMVQLLQFSLNPQMVASWAPTCRTVFSHLANLATWKGQTFSVPSCQCQRLCANCCVRAASLACSFWEAYSPAAHLDFTLTDMSKRRPMLHKWNHVFDRSTESNIWFTSTNNATPPVFTLDCRYFRFDEKILSDLLEVRVGIVGTAVPVPYRLFTSNEQSHADDLKHLAAFDFHFEGTGCEVSAWPPVAPYKSVQCDFDAALYITIVFNQQDGLLSAFMPDGALLLSRRFPSFLKSQPCSSFLYLSSKRQTGSPKPCRLQKGYSIFPFVPDCTVIGGASLSLESGQRSLPLSLPLPCFCAAVFFHALDYCLLLSGGGGAVELSQHGKPLWCSLHDTSDESDSSAAASPLTTPVPSGAVVSLFGALDAPDPAPRAEQVATHQDAFDEQVTRLYADVLDTNTG